MIKKYNIFNEGISQYLKGPSEDELLYSYHSDIIELGKLSGKGLNKIDTILAYKVYKNGVTTYDLLNAISGLTPTQQMIVSTNLNFREGLINAINNGADIHADDDYCYRAACYRGDYEIGKIFLEKGVQAIKGLRYIKGNTPLRELVLQYDWKETRERTIKYRDNLKEGITQYLKGPSKEEVQKNRYEKEIDNILVGNPTMRGKNWIKPYDEPEYIKTSVNKNKVILQEMKERLQREKEEGKSLVKWVWGYVTNTKNNPSSIKIIYYRIPTTEQYTSYVLAEDVDGSFEIFKYDNNLIFSGEKYEKEAIEYYKKIYKQL